MTDNYTQKKKDARTAGILYLALAITGAYGLMYVPLQTYVRGDAAATAGRILANEFLYRSGIASNLVSVTLLLWLAFVLYNLLKDVDKHMARVMVALVVVQVPITFLTGAFKITALYILKGEVIKGMDPAQLQGMSMMFLKLSAYGTVVVEIFWGLWLLPLALLVYRSGFIPRILGWLLLLAGIGYAVDSFTFILFPAFRVFTTTPAYIFSGLGEVGLILWLLVVGVKSKQSKATSVVA